MKIIDGANDWGSFLQSSSMGDPNFEDPHLHELFAAREFRVGERKVKTYGGRMSLITSTLYIRA